MWKSFTPMSITTASGRQPLIASTPPPSKSRQARSPMRSPPMAKVGTPAPRADRAVLPGPHVRAPPQGGAPVAFQSRKYGRDQPSVIESPTKTRRQPGQPVADAAAAVRSAERSDSWSECHSLAAIAESSDLGGRGAMDRTSPCAPNSLDTCTEKKGRVPRLSREEPRRLLKEKATTASNPVVASRKSPGRRSMSERSQAGR
mmetsp:Transcript_127311/g.407545  ORF Transcript_127311/g.407545 Transcript_127311/m.407545 type:complete len:202 (-) Transcript_127311:131-736(-)